jgi:pyrimidine-specific ribonucleoside hydrolase
VVWDRALHAAIARLDAPTLGVRLMHEAMGVYLREHPEGKLMHDPLAACAAIDSGIIDWVEIEPTYAAGRWGSQLAPGSGTFISVDVDHTAFLRTLVAPAAWPPVSG